MKTKTKKRPSGAESLKRAGKVPVQLGINRDDMDLIDAACAADGRSRVGFLTQYAIPSAIAAAKKILEKSCETP